MDLLFNTPKTRDLAARQEALNKSQAVIEFDLDGKILTANDNFLAAMGYTLAEIQGQHHAMFVDPAYRISAEYRQFWEALRRGEFQAAEFRRIGKDGRLIWIQASYNPLFDRSGRPYKVVKYASDVTAEKMKNTDVMGQIEAINKSQAVIHLGMDGQFISANPNFFACTGYTLAEVEGRHHSMFVDPVYRQSQEYREFWEKLRRGEYVAGEFYRHGKGGREIWIQASYNPIFGLDGKPYKVVKYASDVTQQVQARMRSEQVRTRVEESLGSIDRAISAASTQSAETANACVSTSVNMQAVASGAEELSASVQEISESMLKSKQAVDDAFRRTASADEASQRLTDAARSIGSIVELIRNIASQINLLSLNATIESARAGEAGRGFAVVANEVKNLANQASKATENISAEIDRVQGVAADVAESLAGIQNSIRSVQECVTATAGAVEEQSAVTREMSCNMQSAAQAMDTISNNASAIAMATNQADTATKGVQEAMLALAG